MTAPSRRFRPCWAIATALLSSALIPLVLAAPSETGQELFHDERVVRDTAALDLMALQRSRNRPWVVAKVSAKPASGSLAAKGAYIEAETGRIVATPGAHFVLLQEGTVRVIAVLTTSPRKSNYHYRWEFPLNSREIETRERYSPFSSGGTAVCRINEDEAGAAQFRPAYLIPEKWKEFTRPAFQYAGTHAGLFYSRNAAAREAELRRLFEGENPFLAAAACRTLAQAGLLDAAFIDGPLARSRGPRQATATLLVLQHASPAKLPRLVSRIEGLIERARSPDEIQGVALAALAALDQPSAASVPQIALKILQRLNRKRFTVRPDDPAARYLERILEVVSLRNR